MSAIVDETALAPSTDVEVVVNYFKNPGRRTMNYAIKICDSSTAESARVTAHTAFNDPTIPDDAPPRRTIEMRALCFW